MTKIKFAIALHEKLKGLPAEEVEERISFYCEMIDDRMEEGLSEEDAVKDIGSIDDIAAQIIVDVPLVKIVKEKIKPKRRLYAWEIVLLAVGAPLWIPLGISAFAILLSFYLVLWAILISLWAVFVSFSACAFGGIVSGIVLMASGSFSMGFFLLGSGILVGGLAIFGFLLCKLATKGLIKFTPKLLFVTKSAFVRRRREK